MCMSEIKKIMDENELQKLLEVISNQHMVDTYVIAANEMRQIKWSGQCAVIQNTQKRGNGGKHWLLWYKSSPNMVEYWDSFGRSPFSYGVQVPNLKIVKSNNMQFQPDSSSLCGLYCLYVLYHRLNGRSFDKIMQDFSENLLLRNDALVLRFYDNLNIRKNDT